MAIEYYNNDWRVYGAGDQFSIDMHLPDDFSGNAIDYLLGNGYTVDPGRNAFGTFTLHEPKIGRAIAELVPRNETARERYDATHTVQVKLKLNRKTDADILERLDSVPNKQGYIKAALRRTMGVEDVIKLLEAEEEAEWDPTARSVLGDIIEEVRKRL